MYTKVTQSTIAIPNDVQKKSVWAYFIPLMSGTAFFLIYWQAETMPLYVHIASLLGIGIGIFPLALWLAGKKDDLPMFELICLSFVVQFCTPVYLQYNQLSLYGGIRNFAWDQQAQALIIIAIGIFFLGLSFSLSLSRLRKSSSLPRLNLILDPQRRHIFLIIGLSLGVTFKLIHMLFNLEFADGGIWNAPMGVLINLSAICVILLANYYYLGILNNRLWPQVLYCSVGINMLVGLLTGALETALIPLAMLMVMRWQATRQIPYKFIIFGILVFIVIQPIKGEYREKAWQNRAISLSERANIWIEVIGNTFSEKGNQSEASGDEKFRLATQRLDYFHQFVLIYDLTPDSIPYQMGESYNYLFYTWIPRIVWPNKPIAQQANIDFSILYGIQTYEMTLTSMNGASYLTEAYSNFGVPGVIVIMSLLGGLFAVMQVILSSPNSDGGRAIYLSIMITCLNGIGSNTAAFVGGVLQVILINAVLMKPFTLNRNSKTIPMR